MTVAELKDILNDFGDDVEIYINEHDNNVRNIYSGYYPDEEKEFVLIVT